MDKYFSTFDVARICHVSPGSVVRWINEGKLACSLTAGGHHRIHEKDLITLLKSLRMPLPPELTAEDKMKVLIVDDELGIRQMVRWVLQLHFPNAEVEEASEGFIAGWKAHGFCPDLVILDIMIPGMDGYRVCQFIRSFPELKNTRIIIITALNNEEVKQKVLSLGADDYLSKPFDVDSLKEKITQQLEMRKNAEPPSDEKAA